MDRDGHSNVDEKLLLDDEWPRAHHCEGVNHVNPAVLNKIETFGRRAFCADASGPCRRLVFVYETEEERDRILAEVKRKETLGEKRTRDTVVEIIELTQCLWCFPAKRPEFIVSRGHYGSSSFVFDTREEYDRALAETKRAAFGSYSRA